MIIDLGAGSPVRPVMTFTIDGQTYQYTGTDLDIPDKLKITADGDFGWKMWCYDSMSFAFNFINTLVDICAVGHGKTAGDKRTIWDGGGYGTTYFGEPGKGGQVLNESEYSNFKSGDLLEVTLSDNTIVTQKRNNAVVKSWEPTTGGGATAGSQVYVLHFPSSPDRAEGGGGGQNGSYAFNDSSFDNVMYGPGGCDSSYAPGQTNYARGFGGIADTADTAKKAGGKGIVLMRYKP